MELKIRYHTKVGSAGSRYHLKFAFIKMVRLEVPYISPYLQFPPNLSLRVSGFDLRELSQLLAVATLLDALVHISRFV